MFARSFIAALGLAAVAFGSPAKRLEHISVSVTAPDAVDSVEGLKFKAAVKNTGTEAIKVLKYNTILDQLPTRSFVVTKDNKEVEFTGIRLQVSLEEQYSADNFVTIPAGETVTVEHDVSDIYNYEALGAGSYSFAPITDFHVAGEKDELTPASLAKVPVAVDAFTVTIKGDVAKRDLQARNAKRATPTCSNASRLSFIQSSYSEAKSLASITSTWIASNSASSLYTAYWKTNSATTVRGIYNNVANEAGSRTISCTDAGGYCTSGVIAYTFTASPQNVVVCSIFFNEVATTNLCSGTTVASRNIRGGTILHELTHATSGTVDVTYGCAADQALSAANQIRNADNFNCFATQVYANTRC